jgi:sigma-B regulation protein RsbU (phosphoserine phosphatase)
MTRRNVLLALLAVLFAWALASQLPYSWWMLYLQANAARSVQVPFAQAQFSRTIRTVSDSYSQVGLRPGDQVLSLNGIRIDGLEPEARFWHAAKPDDTITVLVNRTQGQQTFVFRLQPHIGNSSEWPLTIIVYAVLPITCLMVGFYIALARPADPLAWITMAMLASFSQAAGSGTSLLLPSPWREFLFVYQSVLGNTWPLWMLLFGFYFPVPFPVIKRMPWIGWLLAMPSLVFASLDIYGSAERLHQIDQLIWLAKFENLVSTPQTIWYVLLVFTFFGALRVKSLQIKNPDGRRRLQVLMAGCSFALTPSLPVAASQIHWIPYLPDWLEAICLSLLILFPATMAYVIVVQRAMDVRMVIRSGVRYAFASHGVKVLRFVISTIVGIQTLRLAREADHQFESLVIAAGGIVLIVSTRRISEWVLAWTDKRFFREAYNTEKILTDLSNSVAGIRDVRELLETVTRRISESLHVSGIAVFLERAGAYRPAYAIGPAQRLGNLEFKPETNVVQFLKRQRAPSKIYFGDPQSWIHGAPEAEQESLRQLDTQVLLPLTLKSRLMGMISLSGKRSEEPYSRADLQLLSAVASQTGLALENAELTESVRREIAQRERLDRELEIAREVQQRLFPQKLPVVNGLDFAGYCRPAEGVGGDYYDFIHLPDSSLGIAVGDVSGKGIAAALMMASLQASLRGQTIKPCETLSEMIQNINGLMYDASAENRYATFFYAQYHPATRALRYVNAGHNPPMVLRGQEFIRLEDGGTVVGLFPEFAFCEGLVQLEPGDVLVAFTDGISEAMNGVEEEFDEARLMDALKKMETRTAAEIISRILIEVDGFTAGARQHDDMTLVVVRVQ